MIIFFDRVAEGSQVQIEVGGHDAQNRDQEVEEQVERVVLADDEVNCTHPFIVIILEGLDTKELERLIFGIIRQLLLPLLALLEEGVER